MTAARRGSIVPAVPERVVVRFAGGPHSGLVVEASADVAERLPDMQFEVTTAGQLFDTVEQVRIRGARVVARPGETPPARPAPEPSGLGVLPLAAPQPVVRRSPTVAGPVFLAPRR